MVDRVVRRQSGQGSRATGAAVTGVRVVSGSLGRAHRRDAAGGGLFRGFLRFDTSFVRAADATLRLAEVLGVVGDVRCMAW